MSGGILTANCSGAALWQCSSQMICPVDDVELTFYKKSSIRGQLWRVDALLVVEAVLAAVIVGIGAYGQRYRHHRITRFLFLGATTLFLPIISSLAFTIEPQYIMPLRDDFHYNDDLSALVAICGRPLPLTFSIILASLVQIVMINTSTIVSVEDREGHYKYPPLELIVKWIWTLYLGVNLVKLGYCDNSFCALLFTPYALLCTKIGLKYYAFVKALQSVALGCNPGLVFVYMQQLQVKEAANQHAEPLAGDGAGDAPPPPLLVMRESEEQVEKHPQGYAFKHDSTTPTLNKNVGLVTIDRVWHLHSSMLPITMPWLKDLCLSFALFKLLRCRFARYKLTNSAQGWRT